MGCSSSMMGTSRYAESYTRAQRILSTAASLAASAAHIAVSVVRCCSGVMVADASVSFLILSKESQITPTNKLMAKKEPMNIHVTAKTAPLTS